MRAEFSASHADFSILRTPFRYATPSSHSIHIVLYTSFPFIKDSETATTSHRRVFSSLFNASHDDSIPAQLSNPSVKRTCTPPTISITRKNALQGRASSRWEPTPLIDEGGRSSSSLLCPWELLALLLTANTSDCSSPGWTRCDSSLEADRIDCQCSLSLPYNSTAQAAVCYHLEYWQHYAYAHSLGKRLFPPMQPMPMMEARD